MFLETKIGDVTVTAYATTYFTWSPCRERGVEEWRFEDVELRDGDGQRISKDDLPWWAEEEIYKALEKALEKRLEWW